MTGLGRFGSDGRTDTHVIPPIRTRTVAGAGAGNITVTGIAVGDRIVSVQRVDAAGANLASEFTVTAANTINNTGGTSTAGQVLLIMWLAHRDRFEHP